MKDPVLKLTKSEKYYVSANVAFSTQPSNNYVAGVKNIYVFGQYIITERIPRKDLKQDHTVTWIVEGFDNPVNIPAFGVFPDRIDQSLTFRESIDWMEVARFEKLGYYQMTTILNEVDLSALNKFFADNLAGWEFFKESSKQETEAQTFLYVLKTFYANWIRKISIEAIANHCVKLGMKIKSIQQIQSYFKDTSY